ncbi:tRNA (N6-isopentenyl adenosine(37)-C2)-methylthiotransferase MiaB [Fodinibius saliphilus]|uniref:tRNA (N6-isopentenyl adenosine(37)-C2)-methylthiotransferase MiaB n=1 Tax=Fodinibius saliphilus TaxID=1920650 RepID=UPI001FE6B465|nr:tRNA (N6-isopentenyl adenosine(37)-C2)-methylthiotransferase MiaB [Fodinibius saliphilus]
MDQRNFYIETYGCQMNVSDTEIVNSILMEDGMEPVNEPEDAEVIFVNTCSIRDNAEERVWNRLKEFKALKREKDGDLTVGVLGCMAERIRDKIMEKEELVDLVVGPDAYRDLPKLLADVDDGRKAVNVLLSLEETYADIKPVRRNDNGVSAFVTIMRGCDNMCAFCVVPFTRGRERSRDAESIIEELEQLSEQGYREVTLLGQNVNSYDDGEHSFADLMYKASQVDPEMRIRFSSPHPKDFPEELLQIISEQPNLCNYIHIPAQSGNNAVLERMRRPYTRKQYLDLVDKMREIIPGVTLSTDIISGFCDETEEEHKDTLSLMAKVKYDLAYMFSYSERGRTLAERKYEDNVPEDVKKRRLSEIIEQQMDIQGELNEKEIGRRHLVLVEGTSKRSDEQLCGRTDTNKMVVFDRPGHIEKGDYVEVMIKDCTSATLMGDFVKKSSIEEFDQEKVAV